VVCKIHTFEANLMPDDEGSHTSNKCSFGVFRRKEVRPRSRRVFVSLSKVSNGGVSLLSDVLDRVVRDPPKTDLLRTKCVLACGQSTAIFGFFEGGI
jgi:hypothetical protein